MFEQDENEIGKDRSPESRSDDPVSVRDHITKNVTAWLDWLEQHTMPVLEDTDDGRCPDLMSLYTEMSALRHVVSTGMRRTVEGIAGISETLGDIEQKHFPSETGSTMPDFAGDTDLLNKNIVLGLVELFSRMERLARRMQNTPTGGLFVTGWKNEWNSIRDGIEIVQSHFSRLLENMSITRIRTAGQPFDPSCMIAVTTISSDDLPDGAVAEEITPGYRLNDSVLKLAEVTVVRQQKEI
ncbi:MAG: nucleotide exchange factor GrpE [Chitinivibrionales bacterium]|nr:nucleotide exchange factor GrpE [Chitinivibrionales bacterium]